jgi:hypothetical protein|tara:strand:- start:1544 stop:1726 length:183 start_codon:yes stop_codon:yes gene_type:complete
MTELQRAYKETNLLGRDLAEIEIEARRDAQESGNVRDNPYDPNSFAALIFVDELTKRIKL